MSRLRVSRSLRRKIRTARLNTGLAAAVLALLLAGCGGRERERAAPTEPKVPARLAADLAERSDSISALLDARDPCAARRQAEALQRRTIAAINARRVPAAFHEELAGRVNALVAGISCTSRPGAGAGSRDARQLADWLRDHS